MFLVGRHTRADEESGRAELVRSARLGRRATLAAALALAVVANLAVGLLVFAAAAGTGLPASGSVLFGVATAVTGFTFAALTARWPRRIFEEPGPRPARSLLAWARRSLCAPPRRRQRRPVLGFPHRVGRAPLLRRQPVVAAISPRRRRRRRAGGRGDGLAGSAGLRRRAGPAPAGTGDGLGGARLPARVGLAAAAYVAYRMGRRTVLAGCRARARSVAASGNRGRKPRGGRHPAGRRRRRRELVPGLDRDDAGTDDHRVRGHRRCGRGPRKPPGGPSRSWPPRLAGPDGWAAT